MGFLKRVGLVGVSAALAAAVFAGTAGASQRSDAPFAAASHVVFVQNDNVAGNQVLAYDRAEDGHLTLAHTYATGGTGGVLAGSVVDHLASQGSLTYDAAHSLLYAVNAGSNTVSVFAVRGDQLRLVQVVSSGGTFPVSVTVHGPVVYVLNALNGGSLQGYAVLFGHLLPIPGSHRALGLDPNATPQFTTTPGQVAFTPDGSRVIVTTKGNGNDIDVFRVGLFGLLSPAPVVNSEPGTVPFAISFDRTGHVVVADAGTNALASYALSFNGSLTPISSVGTGQAATCWVVADGDRFYASNAGSASISGFHAAFNGQLVLTGTTATSPGTVDAAVTTDGHYLYVQGGGNGTVDGFRVNFDGSLTPVGTVTVPNGAGGEGIVAF
jgi:6-phosphogluconolactonase (cycloisomerase 2 family)